MSDSFALVLQPLFLDNLFDIEQCVPFLLRATGRWIDHHHPPQMANYLFQLTTLKKHIE